MPIDITFITHYLMNMKNNRYEKGVRGSVPTHGHTIGYKRSPEFVAWDAMVQRCTNSKHPSYPIYGGRGITICSEFLDFETFIKEAGQRPSPEHSLDRIDNNKGYEPGNIRWVTRKEQQRNMRTNRILTLNGVSKPMVEWAEEYEIEFDTLKSRLAYGWSVEDAITKPLVKSGRPRTRPRVYSRES
jgi:hypothetical protein